MKIYLGSDHAGFEVKEKIKKHLDKRGISYDDLGPYEFKISDDYPDYAFKVAEKVAKSSEAQGILVCGSGAGMAIAANKVKGIRAVEAYDTYLAKMSKEHNNANILAVGARDTKFNEIKKIIDIWLKTKFSDKDRHKRRIRKISNYENKR